MNTRGCSLAETRDAGDAGLRAKTNMEVSKKFPAFSDMQLNGGDGFSLSVGDVSCLRNVWMSETEGADHGGADLTR